MSRSVSCVCVLSPGPSISLYIPATMSRNTGGDWHPLLQIYNFSRKSFLHHSLVSINVSFSQSFYVWAKRKARASTGNRLSVGLQRRKEQPCLLAITCDPSVPAPPVTRCLGARWPRDMRGQWPVISFPWCPWHISPGVSARPDTGGHSHVGQGSITRLSQVSGMATWPDWQSTEEFHHAIE